MPVSESLPMQEYLRQAEMERLGLLKEYRKAVKAGGAPVFVVMSLTGKTPGAKTDREFTRDYGNGKQFDKMGRASRNYILAQAKKNGINISGKIFKSGLGPPSDPRAWVSDRHDVLTVAKEKKLFVEGRVTYSPPEPEGPPKKKPLAQDILRNEVLKRTAANPDLAAKCRESPKALERLKQEVLANSTKKRKR